MVKAVGVGWSKREGWGGQDDGGGPGGRVGVIRAGGVGWSRREG